MELFDKKESAGFGVSCCLMAQYIFRDMDGNFYSLNSQTGRLNWSFNAKGELPLAAFLNDSVYFRNKNYFYGLTQKTGERKWEYDAGSVVGDPSYLTAFFTSE